MPILAGPRSQAGAAAMWTQWWRGWWPRFPRGWCPRMERQQQQQQQQQRRRQEHNLQQWMQQGTQCLDLQKQWQQDRQQRRPVTVLPDPGPPHLHLTLLPMTRRQQPLRLGRNAAEALQLQLVALSWRRKLPHKQLSSKHVQQEEMKQPQRTHPDQPLMKGCLKEGPEHPLHYKDPPSKNSAPHPIIQSHKGLQTCPSMCNSRPRTRPIHLSPKQRHPLIGKAALQQMARSLLCNPNPPAPCLPHLAHCLAH
mmetsp:Transcript_8546/g.22901  ORF Transcript_8546/g.22901 Transcript_8546/m.22901 type:complete len:252 (+) Transcript_8546:1888-2643(+)